MKKMKLAMTLMTVLIIHLFVFCAMAETMTCIIPKGYFVNIRNRPSRFASTLGELHNGDEIEAEEITGGWIKYTLDGARAYAKSDFFELIDGKQYVIEANGRVRYRASPGGEKIGFYSVGEIVTVDAWRYDDTGERWARVGERYVMDEYLDPLVEEEEGEDAP